MRLVLNQHLETKYKGCLVREKLHEKRLEGIGATGWAHVIEAQHGINATIRSMTNQQGVLVNEPAKMCNIFQQYFVQLFGSSGGLECRRDPRTSLPVCHITQGRTRGAVIDRLWLWRWRKLCQTAVGTSLMIFPTKYIIVYQTCLGTNLASI